MAVVFGKDKACMEALKALHELIDRDYKDGGWLPSSSQMLGAAGGLQRHLCQGPRAGWSPRTSSTASRGRGSTSPPSGTASRKSGVVVTDGLESPFWGTFEAVDRACQRIRAAGGYHIHQIQGSSVANVFRNAMSHCVKGLVWLFPSDPALLAIARLPGGRAPADSRHHFWPATAPRPGTSGEDPPCGQRLPGHRRREDGFPHRPPAPRRPIYRLALGGVVRRLHPTVQARRDRVRRQLLDRRPRHLGGTPCRNWRYVPSGRPPWWSRGKQARCWS